LPDTQIRESKQDLDRDNVRCCFVSNCCW